MLVSFVKSNIHQFHRAPSSLFPKPPRRPIVPELEVVVGESPPCQVPAALVGPGEGVAVAVHAVDAVIVVTFRPAPLLRRGFVAVYDNINMQVG